MSARSSIAVSFSVGVAIGALSLWAASPHAPSTHALEPDGVEREIERTALELKSLREHVERLDARIEETRSRSHSSSADGREPIEPSRTADREPAASGATPPAPQSPAIHDNQWTSVLDWHIAQCLVEHGLTPFMPGVSGPVKEAGDALRAASRKFGDEHERLNKLATSTSGPVPGLAESFEANRLQCEKTQREIIDRLSAALDALPK